jgi:hypothetical protein
MRYRLMLAATHVQIMISDSSLSCSQGRVDSNIPNESVEKVSFAEKSFLILCL